MAIEGPISELNLIDLFQILSFNQKTGVLGIDDSEGKKAKVYFERGSVVFVSIEGYNIGLALIKSGILKKEEYEEIMHRVGANEYNIVKEIIEKKIISENEFRKFLRTRVEDIIFNLFKWQNGYFKFEEVQITLNELFKFKIKTEALIMEGSRRIDEWSRLSSKIPSTSIIPFLSDNTEKIDTIDLKPREWEIISMLNGVNSLKDIAEKFGNEFEIAKLIYGMITLGIVIAAGEGAKSDEDRFEMAKTHYKQGAYDKVVEELKVYLKNNSSNSIAYRYIAAAFYNLHQFDKINDYVETAKANNADDMFIKKYNAVSYFRRGQIEKCIKQFEEIYMIIEEPKEKEIIEKLINNFNESLNIMKSFIGGDIE